MRIALRVLALISWALTLTAAALIPTGCASTPYYHRSVAETLDDAGITSRVKTDLGTDPMLQGSDIAVETYTGNVQLEGWVKDQRQKEEAERIARGVSGVIAVQNNLEIEPGAARARPNP